MTNIKAQNFIQIVIYSYHFECNTTIHQNTKWGHNIAQLCPLLWIEEGHSIVLCLAATMVRGMPPIGQRLGSAKNFNSYLTQTGSNLFSYLFLLNFYKETKLHLMLAVKLLTKSVIVRWGLIHEDFTTLVAKVRGEYIMSLKIISDSMMTWIRLCEFFIKQMDYHEKTTIAGKVVEKWHWKFICKVGVGEWLSKSLMNYHQAHVFMMKEAIGRYLPVDWHFPHFQEFISCERTPNVLWNFNVKLQRSINSCGPKIPSSYWTMTYIWYFFIYINQFEIATRLNKVNTPQWTEMGAGDYLPPTNDPPPSPWAICKIIIPIIVTYQPSIINLSSLTSISACLTFYSHVQCKCNKLLYPLWINNVTLHLKNFHLQYINLFSLFSPVSFAVKLFTAFWSSIPNS